MAHKMLKGYSFLLYLLAFLVFFFVGLSYAGLVQAGKGQMLAGGAIVLGYGVVGSVLGLILALFTANNATRKTMIRLNIILAVALIAFWSFYAIKYQKRQQEQQESSQPKTQQPKPKKTAPAKSVDGLQFGGGFSSTSPESSDVISGEAQEEKYQPMGLGLFGPDITENSVLYFYGNINPEKSLDEHMPYDSITFNRDQHNNINIATAPPWLNPQHLKLDYGILLFKVKTALREFIEVEVNVANQQTSYVSTYAGQISYWPNFLLKVHSIELLSDDSQMVKVRPFDHAGDVRMSYNIMQPIAIQQDWVKVALMDNSYKKIGEGWVKWQADGRLLISYSLLS